jgi:Sigma-70, region 4
MDDSADQPPRQPRRRALGRLPRTRRLREIPTDPVLKRPLSDPQMRAAMKRLPASQHLAVTLAAQGFRPAEIGQMVGLSAKTVRQQLYLARRALRELLGEGGAGRGLAAVLGLLPSRLWHWTTRRVARLTDVTSGPAVSATTVVPLVAAALLGAGGDLGAVPVWRGVTGTAPIARTSSAATPARSAGALADDAAASAGTLKAGPVAAGLVGTDGRRVSPATTRLVAVQAAPRYDQNHTVVALGESDQCGCLVLFQSSDGAAHWAWAPGPPAGQQVVLPPDYPADPRIFIGNPATTGGRGDYVFDRFGGHFALLPALSGYLALASDFDHGDPRVYVATTAGVMAVNMATARPSVAVVASELQGPASLASAPGAPGVLALVPPGSVRLSSIGHPLDQQVSPSAALLGCQAEECSPLAETGGRNAQTLVVSATYATDRLLAAWSSVTAALSVSLDGGRSFGAMALPVGTTGVRSVTAGGGRLWAATIGAGGAVVTLHWRQTSGGDWHAVTVPHIPAGVAVQLVALGRDRLLYLVDGQGYRCSTDLGQNWADACPTA